MFECLPMGTAVSVERDPDEAFDGAKGVASRDKYVFGTQSRTNVNGLFFQAFC